MRYMFATPFTPAATLRCSGGPGAFQTPSCKDSAARYGRAGGQGVKVQIQPVSGFGIAMQCRVRYQRQVIGSRRTCLVDQRQLRRPAPVSRLVTVQWKFKLDNRAFLKRPSISPVCKLDVT